MHARSVSTTSIAAFMLVMVTTISSFSFASAIEAITPSNGPITQIDFVRTPGNTTFDKSMLPTNGTASPTNISGTSNTTTDTQTADAPCAPLIQKFHAAGDRDDEVLMLQKFLNQYDNAQIPTTGYFGRKTKAAVQRFQIRYGIPATGNQYEKTTDAINMLHCQFGSQPVGEALKAAATPTTPCIAYLAQFTSVGDRSVDVAKLQLILNVYENAQLPVTGYFGQKTKAAVAAFQKKYNVEPVTGEQFEKTTRALNDMYCGYGGTAEHVSPVVRGPVESQGVVYAVHKKPSVVVAAAANATASSKPAVSVNEVPLPDVYDQSTSAYGDWILLFYALAAIGLIWVVFADVQ